VSVHVCSIHEQGYPQFAHACSLREWFSVGVSHTVSAGVLLRVQAHLKADICLNVLWLLFLTPGPSRILKLSGLQHKQVHVMLLRNIKQKEIVTMVQAADLTCHLSRESPPPTST